MIGGRYKADGDKFSEIIESVSGEGVPDSFAGSTFDWENMVCAPSAAEAAAGKAVCMIVSRETAEGLVLSTCTGTLI